MFPALLHLIKQNLATVAWVNNERACRKLRLAVAVRARFFGNHMLFKCLFWSWRQPPIQSNPPSLARKRLNRTRQFSWYGNTKNKCLRRHKSAWFRSLFGRYTWGCPGQSHPTAPYASIDSRVLAFDPRPILAPKIFVYVINLNKKTSCFFFPKQVLRFATRCQIVLPDHNA